jgi:hypothetical protein
MRISEQWAMDTAVCPQTNVVMMCDTQRLRVVRADFDDNKHKNTMYFTHGSVTR